MASSALDKYCGSVFWNTSLTWETQDPELTKCFEKTVLVWIPCLFLWVFASFEVAYINNSKYKDIPWNILNVSKLLVTILLVIILLITDLATIIRFTRKENPGVYNVDVYSPLIQICSFILSAVLLGYNRASGLRTSGLQFIFWLLVVLCSTPQFITEIHEALAGQPFPYFVHISYLVYYPLTVLMLLLNCFRDKPPKYSGYPKTERPCPEDEASFLSRIFYAWFDPLTWKGYKKPLEASDLWGIRNEDAVAEVVPLFEKHWQKAVEETRRANQYPRAEFKANSGRIDFVNSEKKKEASIFPALCKAYGPSFLFGVMLKIIHSVLTFASPLLLKYLITFVEDRSYPWQGYLYVALLFLIASLQTLIGAQHFQRMSITGLRIRAAVISAIFKKSLRMSNAAKKESAVGEMVNLMAMDAQTFVEIAPYINMVWYAPLEIVLGLYFLWQILGPSVLAGVAVIIILMPLNGIVLANRMSVLQLKQLKCKDERLKIMNEVLSGIKVLKLYAWEPSFESKIMKIRSEEIKALKNVAYVNSGTALVASLAPYLITLVTFITFIHVDEKNVLTPQVAFVSISLFATLHFVMAAFPLVVVWATEAWVSIKRINTFMNLEELNTDNVQHEPSQKGPIVIEGGTFTWGEETILKNINVQFEEGQLTAIVGGVGSGKSSLISAILGEMDKTSGIVNTVGSIAYVSQQAWIQNATLQDNILFGKKLNANVYNNIIDACALKHDFDMLPAGDQTEIGEKGINVSGGQKQRVSLARAVYSNADLYLLDDPLSAVDSHVGKHIFEKVIGPDGLLKHTTRVFVTHGVTYLPMVDKIIVMKDGEVSESGTFRELLDRKGAFAEFLNQYLNEIKDGAEDDLEELKSQLSGTPIGEQLSEKVKRKLSRVSQSESEEAKVQEEPTEGDEKKEVAGETLIEAEKTETGSVKWAVYKHYLQAIGIFVTLVVILLNVLVQAFDVASNLWLCAWSKDTNITNTKRDEYLGVYAALGFSKVVLSFFAALVLFIGALNGAYYLHNILLKNILKAPCNTFFDVTPVGRILNRFSQDIDAVDNTLPMIIKGFNNNFFGVLNILFIISYTTPRFMFVIIPIAIIYFLIRIFYVATSRQLRRIEAVSRPPIYSHFSETVAGASAIRAYGATERFIRESEAKVDLNQMCNYPSIIATRWLSVRLEMIGNLILLFAALFAVISNEKDGGLVGLSIAYALQITQSLNILVQFSSDIESGIVGVERIKEYAETPQEAAWEVPNRMPAITWPDDGTITFKDFAMRYRPALDLVLQDINVSIGAEEKVGIVGRTGAGKSSLTLALFRIIEACRGEIIIDGVNVAGLGLHALRSRLTIIPQDSVLFSGSLRMNLDPFEKYSDEEVWTALEHAQLKEFVKGLTAGLHHEVTEGGENLSVGQRQLVCLSRALLRKSKILILDEATAGVDLESDDLVQKTIRREFKECTILTIAHRLNTIMDSDRVIVLDKGCIAEFDSPGNLLDNRESIFYGMAKDAGLV